MSVKFNRRLFVSFVGSVMASLLAFGASAQQKPIKLDVTIPDGFVPTIGPITSAPTTKISNASNDLLIGQRNEVNPSRLSNRNGIPSLEETGLRIPLPAGVRQ
jgi:hypothetical protein